MRLKNLETGDMLEVPPPNIVGDSVIRFNGRVVERVTYSDADMSVTLGSGRRFDSGKNFAAFLIEQLRVGAYKMAH
jgi:hypothetical protein